MPKATFIELGIYYIELALCTFAGIVEREAPKRTRCFRGALCTYLRFRATEISCARASRLIVIMSYPDLTVM